MTSINRHWHEQNRMPKNPTLELRIQWHALHAANCGCRPIPASLASLVRIDPKVRATSRSTRSSTKPRA